MIKLITNDLGDEIGYSFYCPGCKHSHIFHIIGPTKWEFNGSLDFPTFTPSLKNSWPAYPDAKEEFKEWRKPRICHLILTDGNIHYCEDSTHSLAGKTIPVQLRPDHDL